MVHALAGAVVSGMSPVGVRLPPVNLAMSRHGWGFNSLGEHGHGFRAADLTYGRSTAILDGEARTGATTTGEQNGNGHEPQAPRDRQWRNARTPLPWS